ncbi:GDSL-like Lipase/Acylhydrolase family protein [Artemisia annua]|uniref:GDSL-like Lipase/Acylhydrolase family protein n=1 Tax=Artemisia annua TaxID=35608 RepID=A0A2U1MA03_ARTAN|nr:GDSL-like Lipase/Acylhydrolase family protein [Artemisia annua]
MECFRPRLVILQCVVVFVLLIKINADDPIVPALCIFGDSIMDVGNNNNRLTTLLKANFLPYGRDFETHKPTGRFCNGKLAVDFIADYLGFGEYPPAYLDTANETLLLRGANFASAGSGYYDRTSLLNQAISLPSQISNFEKWQNQVVELVGNETAEAIFSGGIYILSAGTSDFLQNYYINPLLRALHTPSQFSNMLLRSYSNFVQRLYSLGVRRIGVTTLPPTGCLPVAITLFGRGRNNCVVRLNKHALAFNKKLNTTSQDLVKKFPDLKLVVFDIYNPLLNIITKPVENGFFESRRGCCGTGMLATAILCNSRSVGTCSNATGYVFWDGFHTSESANRILAQDLLVQGISLVNSNI